MHVVVGRIGRAHGVRGDVAVELRTDEPDKRFAIGAQLQTDPPDVGPLTVSSVRDHSGRTLVHFEQVSDRSGAERLGGVRLLVDVDPQQRPDDPEEFYDRQLVGLEVVDRNHGSIGTLGEVIHLPGHEVLAVDRPRGGRQVLVPFVSAIVTSVDLAVGQVQVELPDGLLELSDE